MRWQDYILLILLLGGFLIFILFGRNKQQPPARRQSQRKGQLTRREQAAWRRLQEQGFEMLDIHPQVPVILSGEQKSAEFTYAGGFTVKRGGKSYRVKVKRAEGSPFTSAGLRNELLLDYLFYQPEGIFLYDAEKDRLQELRFDIGGAGESRHAARLRPLMIVLLAGCGLALLYHLFFSSGGSP